ncbi:MAG TPA: HD-GYP domain-containing protein [Actinomycetota bacterium]|nr:HD-GYP domain-containing protein [Actinomycetota bacterium]
MTEDLRAPTIGAGGDELSSLRAQLVVFARELAMLYRLERERSRELERALQGLRDTYLATMKVLVQVVEAKDATTRGHLDRTQAYGMALARRIDPALAERPELAYGFFLHDIGKVGIPEAILRKRGPLSDAEWEVMRSHPTLGARIVEPMRFLGEAALVIRHHHERFDGTGYPGGLRGDAIPLPARIFAVADAFDAMTSDRPYRAPLPRERALGELAAARGTQFDPAVVDAFVDLVDEEGAALEAAAVAAG